jgi:hypothetical protein
VPAGSFNTRRVHRRVRDGYSGRTERRSDDPLSAYFPADSGHEARECLADAVERAAAGAVKGRRAARSRRAGPDRLRRVPAGALVRAAAAPIPRRFCREIGRRTDVIGVFPGDRSPIRLIELLRLEQNDEWLVGRRALSDAAIEPLLEVRLHRASDLDLEEVPLL